MEIDEEALAFKISLYEKEIKELKEENDKLDIMVVQLRAKIDILLEIIYAQLPS